MEFGYETDESDVTTCVPVVNPIYPSDIADLAGPGDRELLERAVRELARQETRRALAALLTRLPDTLAYTALRRAVLGDDGEGSREVAERLGVSHSTVNRMVRLLKECLHVPGSQPRNHCKH